MIINHTPISQCPNAPSTPVLGDRGKGGFRQVPPKGWSPASPPNRESHLLRKRECQAAFLDDVAAVMSAGPTSEGTLRFVKTYEVGMNTDSPNGPGPERLICRIPCRPAQIEPNCRPADVAVCRPGLPPAGRWLSTTRRLAWPDLPTWIAGGRERRLTSVTGATSLVAGAPPVRPACGAVVFKLVRPDCAAYYRQLGGCRWPPGTTPWGRRSATAPARNGRSPKLTAGSRLREAEHHQPDGTTQQVDAMANRCSRATSTSALLDEPCPATRDTVGAWQAPALPETWSSNDAA